ncbi:hypothetical protein UA08_07521 [Talaromyces atroroseus]|uniref:Protein ARV n=1 Tax=Talaromyces atroroseus TaxID=1441469 RepID=A0A225A8K9_TALAT|nr:hypothetical protein UA08_07521 [Talaromyces atroroseus]OKL57111.1 hypothetical protein UA08_07521 [Talaromyces atroroseus]
MLEKRRIKCGEEKPRCNNCVKAKRECEGYTQRVVFKNTLGVGYDPAVPANLQVPVTLLPRQQQQQQQQQQHHQHHQQHQRQPGQPLAGQVLNPQQRLLAPRLPNVPPPQFAQPPSQYASIPSRSHSWQLEQPSVPLTVDRYAVQAQTSPPVAQSAYLSLSLGSSHPFEGGFQPGHDPANPSGERARLGVINHALPPRQTLEPPSAFANQHDQCLAGTLDSYTDNTFQQAQAYHSWNSEDQEAAFPVLYSPDAVEDDYYDVDSDEELVYVTGEEGFNQLNLIMASAHQDAIRSYNTYLNEPNILASYQPSMGSSPLNNPKTARIWVHFIHATGPSLSIWERHNTNATTLLSGPVPPSQQGLWTYVMPLKALQHPALLQTILAMSSFHIAKLQENNFIITFKHYQYALRKISKAVGLPSRRKQVATLAATLLLAFYEVTAGEHSKWDSHIAGAAQLLKEIDFVGITRDLRAYRRSILSQKQHLWGQYDAFVRHGYAEDDPFADKELGVDPNAVSTISGKLVDFDRIGHVDSYPRYRRKHFSRKDIDNFRLRCDLYWWYCKQDLFQSLISGNRLHTPYERWDQCPPRAGLGKIDALYGSFDHLVLLMARMMDFGYRDRKRKIRSLEASGGEWRPHPGFFRFLGRFGPPTPPGGPRGLSDSSNKRPPPAGGSGETPMYGMMPTAGPSAAPVAFTSMGESPPYAGFTDKDENSTINEAEAEWESILAAYEYYEKHLGEAFAPLPEDTVTPVSSPFGPALQYRSHKIAVLWAYYYTGRIMLNRLHPSMPPAAMIATVTSASTCEGFAQTIGKIAAGSYYPQMDTQEIGSINPNLGAAWIEITLTLYVAAVQYTDATQRAWTVATFRNLARLTGWKSAETIANGCEFAWIRRAEAGRGPFYRPSPVSSEKEGVNAGGEWINRQTTQDPNNERRFVTVERPHTPWAQGLLQLESDLTDLKLGTPWMMRACRSEDLRPISGPDVQPQTSTTSKARLAPRSHCHYHVLKMPMCIECSYPVSQLYTSYSKADDRALGKGVRLTQCPRCKRFADKYVEHDNVVLFIDLVLIKPQVYRHLLFNRLGRDDKKLDRSIIRLGVLLLLFDVYLTWARIEKSSTLASTSLSTSPIIVQYLFFLTLNALATLAHHLVVRLGASIIPKRSQTTSLAPGDGTNETPSTPTLSSPSLASASMNVTRSSSSQDILHRNNRNSNYPPSYWPPDTSPPLAGQTTQLRRVSTSPAQLQPLPPPSPPSANAVSTALFVSSCPKLFPILLVIWGSKEAAIPDEGSATADSPAVTKLHQTLVTTTSSFLSGSTMTRPEASLSSSYVSMNSEAAIRSSGIPTASFFGSSFATLFSAFDLPSLLSFLSLGTASTHLVLLNNTEALYILLDCGYLWAVALAVAGQLARWLVEKLILRLFGIY